MIESLASLGEQLKELGGRLHCIEIDTHTNYISKIHEHRAIQGVWWNQDVTPFARQRDDQVRAWCEALTIPVHVFEDYMLHSVDSVRTQTGNVYQVYTPFYRACQRLSVSPPKDKDTVLSKPRFTRIAVFPLLTSRQQQQQYVPAIEGPDEDTLQGGRDAALAILRQVRRGVFDHYETERNDPGAQKTTRIAPYLKFGCISIREAYAAMKHVPALIGELYWREFYFYLTYHQPRLLAGQIGKKNESFRTRLEYVHWKSATDSDVRSAWSAWCTGQTGYPIVDAGMRQLLRTGYMHNRVRMIVAMFLTKHLHIHWHEGERFFAQHLVDYDPCQNNGGWQWSASTGVDTQPYRIFNPWTQTLNYDPEAVYIRRWVPELADVPVSHILHWHKPAIRQAHASISYPFPIVDHAKAVAEGKALLRHPSQEK
jgi:deoxyribodipyrimidine photo-lyase